MAKHALKKKTLLKRLTALGAALAMTVTALVGVQASTPVNVAGESGDFSVSFVGVTGVTAAGGVLTFTTNAKHYYFVGDKISTEDFNEPGFNLSDARVASTPSATTFTVVNAATGATSSGIAIKAQRPRIAVTDASGNGTLLAITAPGHGLSVGDNFELSGISRVDGSSMNSDYLENTVASVPNSNTFTFSSTSTAIYISGGTLRTNLIGLNLDEDEPIYFRNVFSVGGTFVHARVTLSDQADLEGYNGDLGVVENLQYPQSDTAENSFLNSVLDFEDGDQDSFAEFTVLLFTGSPTAAASNPVTVSNLTASVYDIDGLQYSEFSNVQSIEPLDPNTILTQIPDPATLPGTVRFIEQDEERTGGTDSFTLSRATVVFADTSSFVYRIGQVTTPQTIDTGSASFALDLSSGIRVATFNANQGTGSMDPQSATTATALTANAFEREGFTFAGWNTAANGSGTAYADGASFPFTANTTLFAQWTAVTQPGNTEEEEETPPSAPVVYSGPVPVSLNISCLAANTTGTAKLTGERLNIITSATVDGKAITLSSVTASSVTLALPALAAGTYDITYLLSSGSITHQDSLRVCASNTPAAGNPVLVEGATKPFSVAKRFSNYRGDRGPVVARDQAAISAFINANPGLTHVTCVGSTSGRPALPTDRALAMSRAKNACSVVESLVPGVKTRLVANTGRGVGQFFRAVTLFGKGERAN